MGWHNSRGGASCWNSARAAYSPSPMRWNIQFRKSRRGERIGKWCTAYACRDSNLAKPNRNECAANRQFPMICPMLREADLRHRLLSRIHRRYRTVTQTVELPSLRFDFTRIADPDIVLDQVAAEVDLQQRLHGR